jgi:hypothetical protein
MTGRRDRAQPQALAAGDQAPAVVVIGKRHRIKRSDESIKRR